MIQEVSGNRYGSASGCDEQSIRSRSVLMASRDSSRARQTQAAAGRRGLTIAVATRLITQFSRCGSMKEAMAVFDRMEFHDPASWTALMLGYVDNGDAPVALELFERMVAREGCQPDARAFVVALKACARLTANNEDDKDDDEDGSIGRKFLSLERAMFLHSHLARSKWDSSNAYVVSSLVALYAKCGAMVDAWRVFDKAWMKLDTAVWNSLVLGNVENGDPKQAVDLLAAMTCSPDRGTCLAALSTCSSLATKEVSMSFGIKLRALEFCMAIHSLAAKRELELDVFVVNTLIDAYANCGSLEDAKRVFDKLDEHDTVSWTALIHGYAENSESLRALELFEAMEREGVCEMDSRVFVAVAKACSGLAEKEEATEVVNRQFAKVSSLERGMSIHSRAGPRLARNKYLASTLVEMYAKCGSMLDAQRVFDGVSRPGVVLWNGLILGYVENGESELALEIFVRVLSCQRDDRTFVAALKACSSLASTEQGRQVGGKHVKIETLEKVMAIHARALLCNRDSKLFVANSLIDLYTKVGSIDDSARVFNTLKNPDAVSWNTLILGYAQLGEGEEALNLFAEMQNSGFQPDARTYVAALKACIVLAASEKGQRIEGEKVVKKTSLEVGFAIHSQAAERRFDRDAFVGNSLCAMYTNCGSMADAVTVFESIAPRCIVSWTALMIGYAENGEEDRALELLAWISSEQCCKPDSKTYVAALKACINLAAKEEQQIPNSSPSPVKMRSLEKGMAVHSHAARSKDLVWDSHIDSILVHVYAKCGSPDDARRTFESRKHCRNSHDDQVLSTSLILAYAESGQRETALEIVRELQSRHSLSSTSAWTLAAALKACGCAAALELGRSLHGDLCRLGLESEPVVVSALVSFYGSCGIMASSQLVFDCSSDASDVAWSALITGYSHQGQSALVLDFFREMVADLRVAPSSVAFLAVLSACSHVGLLGEGRRYFETMQALYGIRPSVEHYHAMIDMFARGNELEEALAMVEAMPYDAGVVTWTTMLGACVRRGNCKVGTVAFEALVALDEKNCASYQLMANNLLFC